MARRLLIELLTYPQNFVSGQVMSEACDHGWHFSEHHADCQHCWHNLACSWLQQNDDCVDLESRSVEDLLAALESALGQVDAHLLAAGHDRRSCHCDTCRWYRRAQRHYLEICDGL